MCTILRGFEAVATQDKPDQNQYPVIQILDTETLFFACMMQPLNDPLLPTLWSVHELNVFARKTTGDLAEMDSLNKHVKQISFGQWVTCCEHGQMKRWQTHFQPTVAKRSISTSVRVFAAVI